MKVGMCKETKKFAPVLVQNNEQNLVEFEINKNF